MRVRVARMYLRHVHARAHTGQKVALDSQN